MFNVSPRTSRITLPVWLAIASLVPAQNAPEKLPEPNIEAEAASEETAKAPEPEKAAEQPKLPEPDAPANGDLPKPADPATPPVMPKVPSDGTPALPIPQAPPEGATDLPLIPGAPVAPAIPGAPVPDSTTIPWSLPGDPATGGDLGAPLLPGTDSTLLAPGELPLEGDPFAAGEETLLDGQPADGLFGDPLSDDLPADSAPESPFGADQGSFGFEEEETEGFSFFIDGTSSYSSNLELRENNEESTWYTTLSPGFNYRSALSGRAVNTITADYLSDFNFYHDNAIDDTINHDLNVAYTHRGSRALLELKTSFLQETDSSRFTDTLTESTNLEGSLDFAYKMSAKTNLYASAEFSTRENDISPRGDSDLFTTSISALWDYSSKTDLGPSLRYANNSSGATGDSESVALTLEARYAASKKLNLVINAGIEASTYNDDDTEYSPAGSLRATYTPNPVWQFTGDLRYQAIPVSQLDSETFGGAFSGGGFTELNGAAAGGGQQLNGSFGVVYSPGQLWRISSTISHRTAPSFINANESLVDTTFNFRVLRRIGDATLAGRYSFSTTEFEGEGAVVQEDQDYHQFGINYNHPDLFKEVSFRVGIGYAVSSGGRDYDQTSASVSFGYRF